MSSASRATRSNRCWPRRMAVSSLESNVCCWPTAEGDDLLGLLVAADMLRRDLVGNLVTYVVNRNINFTNVCFVGCKFCAFSRGPREDDTLLSTALRHGRRKPSKLGRWARPKSAFRAGCPTDLPPFYYRDILRAVKAAVPEHAHSRLLAHGDRLRHGTHRHAAAGLSCRCCATTASTLFPAPPPKFSTTTCASCSRATNFPPNNGSEVIRTAHQLRHSQHLHADVRPRRDARRTGSTSCCCFAIFSSRLEASRNLFRWASCIRTRCCSIRELRGPAPPWPSISKFTPWPGSCWPAPSTIFRSRG